MKHNPKQILASSILTITVSMSAAPLLPICAYERRIPPPIPAAVSEEEKDTTVYYTKTDLDWLCRCVKAEIGGGSLTAQSQVVWCVLNRLDDGGFGNSITDVITAKNQFAYSRGTGSAVKYEWIVKDVLTRWIGEKKGESTPETSGRTLPPEYKYFWGDGKRNHFTEIYGGKAEYDGSLGTPYKEDMK